MLRRRRGRDEDQPGEAGPAGTAAEQAGEDVEIGPWDVGDDVPQADLYILARFFCGRTGQPGLLGLVLVPAAPSTQHLKLPTALR